jgi:phage anti-repressor protein
MEVLLQLSLGKFVKEFAKHLSVIEYEEGVLTLGLPKGKLNLLDSECALKIELAIQEYTSDPDIDVHVCVIDDDGEAIIDDAPPVDEADTNDIRPLVPITLAKIGDNEVNSVSARDLYLDLGLSEAHWAKWSKLNILENEFLKRGIDFIPLTQEVSNKSKGNSAQDYAVTINTAKHIAMMAKTQRAHDYRNYFIECEKIAKGETSNKKIDLLSPEFIAAMRKVRTVQLATGMTKVQSSKFAREVIKREFGADMVHEVIGDYLQQLDLV